MIRASIIGGWWVDAAPREKGPAGLLSALAVLDRSLAVPLGETSNTRSIRRLSEDLGANHWPYFGGRSNDSNSTYKS